MQEYEDRYQREVAYVIKTIKEHGRIWEYARLKFESGEYKDYGLARMLTEGVIVPSPHPHGGYVLPQDKG